jgi:hypothetical protein
VFAPSAYRFKTTNANTPITSAGMLSPTTKLKARLLLRLTALPAFLLLPDDPAIIQELDWHFVLSMFPHEGIKPDTALANPKICGGEPHPGTRRLLPALRRVFRLPAKYFALPVLPGGVELAGKSLYFT